MFAHRKHPVNPEYILMLIYYGRKIEKSVCKDFPDEINNIEQIT